MQEKAQMEESMRARRLPAWETIPDLGLYMDQVVTYLERQCGQPGAKRPITPSMVNNYVKGGLVSRPVAKKYDRLQLAQLMVVCTLKQVLPLEALRRFVAQEEATMQALYDALCEKQQDAMVAVSQRAAQADPLDCALLAAEFISLCAQMLGLDS